MNTILKLLLLSLLSVSAQAVKVSKVFDLYEGLT